MSAVPNIRLNNGVQMPQLGFGVWQVPDDQATEAVSTALEAGYRSIDTAAAKASPGVVAVFTGADMATNAMAPMRPLWAVRSRDGSAMAEPPRFALARGTVRHGGEPVVGVIADTLTLATDAAERVEVEYEPLSAVTDARAAQAPGAPQLHQSAPGNVCFRWARGDEAAVRAAFASAA